VFGVINSAGMGDGSVAVRPREVVLMRIFHVWVVSFVVGRNV